jgi:hypothetical protein
MMKYISQYNRFIKESLLESTKDYSDKKLKRYIIFHRILLVLYSEFIMVDTT